MLRFKLTIEHGDMTSGGTLTFNALPQQRTELHWIDSGNVGANPLKRFMIPFVTPKTAETLDASLASIKKHLEHSH
jgi:hypothetical protein